MGFVVNTDKGYLLEGLRFSNDKSEAIKFGSGLGKKERRNIYNMLIKDGVVNKYWYEDEK